MRLRLLDHRFVHRPVHTRLPFKFGVQVLREVPLAELQVTLETPDGDRIVGRSSDLLVPKWFEKNPDTTPEQDSAALADSVRSAVALAAELTGTAGPHPVFDVCEVVRIEQVGRRGHRDADVLVRGFGVAMVERALIDGACRLAGMSFHEAITATGHADLLGFSPKRVVPEVGDWSPATLATPAKSLAVRHTVGMLDPLTVEEIPKADRVLDGLPQALEEDIAAYGVSRFKVKIGGDLDANRNRLREVSRVVMDRVGDPARFTLDGNEQCRDLEALAGLLEDLSRDAVAAPMIERLELVEQPLPRVDAFAEDHRGSIQRLSRIAPVIIDEADTDRDAFRRAIDLGYAGTSVKACKGVFRAIANRGLVETRTTPSGIRPFQSGEDLTNLGSIPLQQDLCLQATLGVRDVERNGHHYFRGLDHLSDAVADEVVESVPALYQRDGDLRRLRIEQGRLDLTGVAGGIGFGGPLGSIDPA